MKKSVSLLTLLSLVLGVLFGLFFPDKASLLQRIGTVYIDVLKILIAPVLITSISVTAYEMKNTRDHLLFRAVGLFLVLFLSTFFLSSLIVLLIDPVLKSALYSSFLGQYTVNVQEFTLEGFLQSLLPDSFLSLFTGKKLFFLIILSFLLGTVLRKLRAERIMEVIKKGRDLVYRCLSLVLYATPVAVFAISANLVAMDRVVLLSGMWYILTAYIAGIMAMILIMILPVVIFKHIPLKEYVSKLSRIWLVTLTTCSSAATLPHTLTLCKEELGIEEKIVDLVVPLGCTINMCGGAVSFSLLGLFCARLYMIPMNLPLYLYMTAAAVFLNMAAPGIPNGGVVVGATFLELLGIPLGFIGFYSGIYKVLDMLYTTINVSGDVTASVLLSERRRP